MQIDLSDQDLHDLCDLIEYANNHIFEEYFYYMSDRINALHDKLASNIEHPLEE